MIESSAIVSIFLQRNFSFLNSVICMGSGVLGKAISILFPDESWIIIVFEFEKRVFIVYASFHKNVIVGDKICFAVMIADTNSNHSPFQSTFVTILYTA